MTRKVGILLVNLGTPKSWYPKDVFVYLKQFLLDKRVIDLPFLVRHFIVRCLIIPFRYKQSSKTYQTIWTEEGSPLLVNSQNIANALQKELGGQFIVTLAMRYQQPSISRGLEILKKKEVHSIVALPLFPQYASATSGSIFEEIMHHMKRWELIPTVHFLANFSQNERFVSAIATICKQVRLSEYDHILCSFHGLPKKQIFKADTCNHCLKKEDCCFDNSSLKSLCYRKQCLQLSERLRRELSIKQENFTACFQSRLGKDAWLEPYTNEVVRSLAKKGIKNILVMCPSFVCDCLETIYEIGQELRTEFLHLGGKKLDLIPCVNDHPIFIQSLKEMIGKIYPEIVENSSNKPL